MTTASFIKSSGAIPAIFIGATVAAVVDYGWAVSMSDWNMAKAIAGGLLGREEARQGGLGTVLLGTLLHFLIMYVIAAIYFGASCKLEFLKKHWIICGIYLAITEYLVMTLIVVPLSALHAMSDLPRMTVLRNIVVHAFIIGLPISYSVKRFSKPLTHQ